MIHLYPALWVFLGAAIYHVWLCYRKQAKGIFPGGEIELIRIIKPGKN